MAVAIVPSLLSGRPCHLKSQLVPSFHSYTSEVALATSGFNSHLHRNIKVQVALAILTQQTCLSFSARTFHSNSINRRRTCRIVQRLAQRQDKVITPLLPSSSGPCLQIEALKVPDPRHHSFIQPQHRYQQPHSHPPARPPAHQASVSSRRLHQQSQP
jgi:hypothetical protein